MIHIQSFFPVLFSDHFCLPDMVIDSPFRYAHQIRDLGDHVAIQFFEYDDTHDIRILPVQPLPDFIELCPLICKLLIHRFIAFFKHAFPTDDPGLPVFRLSSIRTL